MVKMEDPKGRINSGSFDTLVCLLSAESFYMIGHSMPTVQYVFPLARTLSTFVEQERHLRIRPQTLRCAILVRDEANMAVIDSTAVLGHGNICCLAGPWY